MARPTTKTPAEQLRAAKQKTRRALKMVSAHILSLERLRVELQEEFEELLELLRAESNEDDHE